MTKDEVAAAVEAGMNHFFTKLGLDTSTPEAVIEIQRDVSFLRRMRTASSSISSRALGALVLAILGVFGTLLTLGINDHFKG